jgi:hypothetical protein
MTMENSGHEETNSAADKGQPPVAAAVPNPSRRRFTRAGVGASAVVMTLASRSVLANVACGTASGFTSVNQSARPGDELLRCDGITYQAWIGTANWPIPKTKIVNDAFLHPVSEIYETGEITSGSGTTTPSVKLKKATLEQALLGSKTPEVVRYLIAALLNAHAGKSTNPSVESVQTIFKEWSNKGFYEVTRGIQWGPADIIKYLEATQTPRPMRVA